MAAKVRTCSSRQGFALVCPAKRLGQRGVEIVDETQDLLAKILLGKEVAAPDHLLDQDRKPDFYLIEPRRMFRRKMKDDLMTRIPQKGLARGHVLQDARFPFLAQRALFEAAQLGHESNRRRRFVRVEIVGDDVPAPRFRRAGDKGSQIPREVFLRARFADLAEDLSTAHVESGDQRLGAVADVFKLAPLGLAGLHRQPRSAALKRLDAGHFVDRQRHLSLARALGGGGVNGANIAGFLFLALIALRCQPVADELGFKVSLILKNARRTAEKRNRQCLV